jgi:hypothetical protein
VLASSLPRAAWAFTPRHGSARGRGRIGRASRRRAGVGLANAVADAQFLAKLVGLVVD